MQQATGLLEMAQTESKAALDSLRREAEVEKERAVQEAVANAAAALAEFKAEAEAAKKKAVDSAREEG